MFEKIKSLRDRTGAGMMDCRKALEEAGGDEEKAILILREKGQAKAAKKAERAVKAGLVEAYSNKDGRVGVLMEMLCETDFVARNENFVELIKGFASHIADKNPADEAEFFSQPYSGDTGRSIQETLNDAIAKIGENIKIGRFSRFETDSNGLIEAYIHGNGRVGVLIELSCENEKTAGHEEVKQLAHDLALQIAAMDPAYVSAENVPAEAIEAEKEIYLKQVEESGKPKNIIDQIIEGKIKKFKEDASLLTQVFVKDQEKKVQQVVKSVAEKAGGDIKITKFVRYQI